MTLEEFKQKLIGGFKGDCPCCGRYSQIYHRHIHSGIASQLIKLYMLGGYGGHFVHASDLIPAGQASSGDLSKAKYWGLLDKMPHEEGQTKSSGYWSLSPFGVEFVKGSRSIPKTAIVFDDVVIKYSDELVDIKDCLGVKFDYLELMRER